MEEKVVVHKICTTILTKVSDRKPGAFGHFYMSDRKATVSGANLALKVVLRKIHTFVAYLKKKLKKLTTPIFLVGLIYRWGKGPKLKNICINVTFSYTICEKIKKKFFLTFFDFFDFLGR